METTIMAVTIDHRTEFAPDAQTVLTKYGCIIKTRIGLHEEVQNSCTDRGLILLHVISKPEEMHELESELTAIEGVEVKSMSV